MRYINEYYYNHVELNINIILNKLNYFIDTYMFIYISSIDSTRNLFSLTTINNISNKYQLYKLGKGIILNINELETIANIYNIFNGFDEVWFLNTKPLIELPDELNIISSSDITETIPNNIVSWMTKNNCQLGLGDGIGLNYITINKNIANMIEDINKDIA